MKFSLEVLLKVQTMRLKELKEKSEVIKMQLLKLEKENMESCLELKEALKKGDFKNNFYFREDLAFLEKKRSALQEDQNNHQKKVNLARIEKKKWEKLKERRAKNWIKKERP